MKKLFCILLAFIVLFECSSCSYPEENTLPESQSSTQPEYTANPLTLSKQEAVFATLSSDGTPISLEVTDRLTTDRGEVKVEDITFLSDIRNIKGSEIPIQDGVNLTWHMQSPELYYSGTTSKELPVRLQIRYFLNDQETTAEALKRKDGHIRINVSAENKLQHGDLYTPFLLVGGAILENARNIEISNGGSFGDGNHDIAFGVILPGVKESLQLTENTLIPDHFSIQFDTNSFAINELYFAMVPLSTDKLSDAVESVFHSANLPGTELKQLFQNMNLFTEQNDMEALIQTVSDHVSMLESVSVLMQDLDSIAPLLSIFQKYMTTENANLIQDTLDSLNTTSLQEYAALLKNPTFIAMLGNLGVVSSAFSDLIPQITALLSDLNSKDAKAAMQNFPKVLSDLKTFSASAEENTDWMQALQSITESGMIAQFSTFLTNVQNLVESGTLETLSSIAANTDGIQERMESMLELGKKYSIFTIAPEDAVSSVYFVMKVKL